MRLYLVRHGEAEAASPDFARRLTPAGRAAVERLAERALAAGVLPDEIRHSGLVRAQETAEILARRLEPPHGVAATPGLTPEDDEETAAIELGLAPGPVLVVSHMPLVARLAGRLIAGRRSALAAPFATAELRGFEPETDHWRQVLELDGSS